MISVQKQLIYTGFGIPLLFWGTLALCGILFGEYSHFSNLVSELGAAGTRTQVLFSLGLLFCSILSLAFVVGLYRECRKAQMSVMPVLFVLTYTFSIAGAAIYPLPHRLHGVLGSPSIFLILSPVLAFLLWRQTSSLAGIRLFSILSFLIMSLGFLAFLPSVLESYPGLKQRFFHAGWSLWFAYLSVGFSGILEQSRASTASSGTSVLTSIGSRISRMLEERAKPGGRNTTRSDRTVHSGTCPRVSSLLDKRKGSEPRFLDHRYSRLC